MNVTQPKTDCQIKKIQSCRAAKRSTSKNQEQGKMFVRDRLNLIFGFPESPKLRMSGAITVMS
jgi:hypothetical protein